MPAILPDPIRSILGPTTPVVPPVRPIVPPRRANMPAWLTNLSAGALSGPQKRALQMPQLAKELSAFQGQQSALFAPRYPLLSSLIRRY